MALPNVVLPLGAKVVVEVGTERATFEYKDLVYLDAALVAKVQSALVMRAVGEQMADQSCFPEEVFVLKLTGEVESMALFRAWVEAHWPASRIPTRRVLRLAKAIDALGCHDNVCEALNERVKTLDKNRAVLVRVLSDTPRDVRFRDRIAAEGRPATGKVDYRLPAQVAPCLERVLVDAIQRLVYMRLAKQRPYACKLAAKLARFAKANAGFLDLRRMADLADAADRARGRDVGKWPRGRVAETLREWAEEAQLAGGGGGGGGGGPGLGQGVIYEVADDTRKHPTLLGKHLVRTEPAQPSPSS